MDHSNNAEMANTSTGRVLTINRIFNAPRPTVFKAFSDPKRMLQWLGPRDYPANFVEADVRPGGKWRACLDSEANGEELWHGGTYYEVVPNERLVFTFAWDQEDGKAGRETLITINFEDLADKTKMQFQQSEFETIEDCEDHREGWNSAFDRLEELLA